MDDEELKAERDNLEYEEYEKDDSEDTFEIWKLKKHIDERIEDESNELKEYVGNRINQLIVGVVIVGALIYWFFR